MQRCAVSGKLDGLVGRAEGERVAPCPPASQTHWGRWSFDRVDPARPRGRPDAREAVILALSHTVILALSHADLLLLCLTLTFTLSHSHATMHSGY